MAITVGHVWSENRVSSQVLKVQGASWRFLFVSASLEDLIAPESGNQKTHEPAEQVTKILSVSQKKNRFFFGCLLNGKYDSEAWDYVLYIFYTVFLVNQLGGIMSDGYFY